jgi:hypothetical protein
LHLCSKDEGTNSTSCRSSSCSGTSQPLAKGSERSSEPWKRWVAECGWRFVLNDPRSQRHLGMGSGPSTNHRTPALADCFRQRFAKHKGGCCTMVAGTLLACGACSRSPPQLGLDCAPWRASLRWATSPACLAACLPTYLPACLHFAHLGTRWCELGSPPARTMDDSFPAAGTT